MAYFVPMGKEETGFATFPLPQKIRTSLSGLLTAFPCWEGDYGLAETLRESLQSARWPQPNGRYLHAKH